MHVRNPYHVLPPYYTPQAKVDPQCACKTEYGIEKAKVIRKESVFRIDR